MRTFIESRLEFTFDDNWGVEKWDEQPAYRDPTGFGSLPATLACDFMAHHESHGVYLIEVKNFTDFHHANRAKVPSGAMTDAVAAKVRDTVAGAIWTRGRSFDVPPIGPLTQRTVDALVQKTAPLHVVLWLEDRPPLRPLQASTMRKDLQRQLLRQLNIRSVLVTSCAVAQADAVPGLTVRPVP